VRVVQIDDGSLLGPLLQLGADGDDDGSSNDALNDAVGHVRSPFSKYRIEQKRSTTNRSPGKGLGWWWLDY
jgi:hypothetical protein